jgi:hypothetical protein
MLKKEEITDMNELPYFGHINCGKESYNVIKPAKKGFYWHCYICKETRFFSNLDIIECPHTLKWRTCKNGFLTAYCALCGIRIFRKPIESKESNNINKAQD